MLGSQGNRAAREAAGGLYSQGTAGHGGQLCQRCTEQCHGDNESLGRNRAWGEGSYGGQLFGWVAWLCQSSAQVPEQSFVQHFLVRRRRELR